MLLTKELKSFPRLPYPPISPIPPIFTIATQLNQSQDCPKSEKQGIYFWTTCGILPSCKGIIHILPITFRLASSRPADCVFPFSATSTYLLLDAQSNWPAGRINRQIPYGIIYAFYRLWNLCFYFYYFYNPTLIFSLSCYGVDLQSISSLSFSSGSSISHLQRSISWRKFELLDQTRSTRSTDAPAGSSGRGNRGRDTSTFFAGEGEDGFRINRSPYRDRIDPDFGSDGRDKVEEEVLKLTVFTFLLLLLFFSHVLFNVPIFWNSPLQCFVFLDSPSMGSIYKALILNSLFASHFVLQFSDLYTHTHPDKVKYQLSSSSL